MTFHNLKAEAQKRWRENQNSNSGRSRGLILENWTEAIEESWVVDKSPWMVMAEKQIPEKFDVLVIENLRPSTIVSDGSFVETPDGKVIPSETQRILVAATLAVRESKPILVSTPVRFGSLKKVNLSEVDVSMLDVGSLLAGEELIYLLQSYCESIDDDATSRDSLGALYMTPIERRLAKLMKASGVEFQAQAPVGRYFADFLIGEKLVVECDGEAWHDPESDSKRDSDLAALGFRTLRITGRAINNDPKGSIARIRAEIVGQLREDLYEPMELTEAQKKAAKHWNGPILVVAPAGSGKTKVVAERIKFLVSRGALPERICAISFTNAAVGEIADRIPEHDDVETTTLHSLASRICKEHYGERSVVQNVKKPRVPTRSDILRQALLETKISPGRFGQQRGLLEAIEHYRNSLVVPNLGETALVEIKDSTESQQNQKFLSLHAKYEELLKKKNLTDFDGMVLDAIRILQRDERARMIWSRKYDYWMVDEFQDLARPKVMLLRLLVSPARNLMAVGDDDQIIYGFAGSKQEIFSILNHDWRDMTALPLDINFRCPHDLVVRSQWLIENNQKRIPKTITANRELTKIDNVIVNSNQNYDTFALNVVLEEIKKGRTPSDIALLFRVSMAAAPVEMLFQRHGIKFESLAKNSLIYNPTINWLRSWLRVVNNLGGEDDWKSALHRPRRYLSVETVDWLTFSNSDDDFGPEKRIEEGIKNPEVIPRKNQTQQDDLLVDSLREFMKSLRDARAVGDSPSRQLRMLNLNSALSKEEDERLKRNLHESNTGRKTEMAGKSVDPLVVYKIFYALAEASDNYLQLESWFDKAESDPDISLDEESEKSSNADDRVVLRTIHGFKGKEKPVVLVLGPEGAMPDRRAHTDEELEEERRIAYVAVTRAKDRLYFAASSQYKSELDQSSNGETWTKYRQRIENPGSSGSEKTGIDGGGTPPSTKKRPGPPPSTEKRPGTLGRILEWFLTFLDS